MIDTIACDWTECPTVARFHIEVPLNRVKQLAAGGGVRLPFSHTHNNVCAAHLDEYSARFAPTAIYAIGKCPHCNSI
ncbi:MAG TPA: hypothetical protein VGI80_00895 [Pyrinomonadaceae bacterium]